MTTPREALAHLEKELARLEIYVESFLSVPSNRDERQVLATELLPFNKSTAEYLVQIAKHPDLSNSHHGGNLPASWRTLAVLAHLASELTQLRITAATYLKTGQS